MYDSSSMSNDEEAVRHLLALGLSDYEARLYVALIAHGPLTGYEVSKRSGVPRPNAYAALQRLEQRGAVSPLATTRGARYAAHPPADVLDRRSEEHTSELQSRGHLVCRLLLEKKKPTAHDPGSDRQELEPDRALSRPIQS